MMSASPKEPRRVNDIDKHVGKNLAFFRKQSGMTQENLAESVGLTFQQIQKYETGKNRISASRMYFFAQILKVDVNNFYHGISNENHRKIDTDNPLHGVDKKTIELLTLFKRIENQGTKRALMQVLRALAK